MSVFPIERFAPYFQGKEPPPNFHELPIAQAASIICLGGIEAMRFSSWVKRPYIPDDPDNLTSLAHAVLWARWFLNRTQSGEYDGTGLVFWWHRGTARAGRFALCVHEKVVGAGANPSRGYHPGHCKHCGLNMTVDSGD